MVKSEWVVIRLGWYFFFSAWLTLGHQTRPRYSPESRNSLDKRKMTAIRVKARQEHMVIAK